jgi:hypothetical protein
MTVLQTIALPLGYSAIRMARGRLSKVDRRPCQHLDLRKLGNFAIGRGPATLGKRAVERSVLGGGLGAID